MRPRARGFAVAVARTVAVALLLGGCNRCDGCNACNEFPTRIHVTRMQVPAGEPVVVHLEDATSVPRSGRLWLTLAPSDAAPSYVGERVLVDPNATHATVPTNAPGRYEVRLHDDYPERPHHLIARARVEVSTESASATFVPN